MNKVITINLAGRLITIDEEAYQQLSAYLKWLQQFFSKEEGGVEIYRDMEDRIAELFDDKLRKNLVSISTEDVQAVIKIMGSPEQIAFENADHIEEANPSNNTQQQQQQSQESTSANIPTSTSLKRNLNDKIMGGVCSGLANYFNTDVNLVRVLMVLGFFFYGSTLFLYCLLWIALPGVYQENTTSLKRRWYRSDDGKILGGVCNGIAHHLHISKQWLRVLFAFPLFGVIFFNIINEDDLASFCTAALPIMTIIYIVLWIALPKANSLTQKMELKGERLDVQNLRTALKEQNESNAPLQNTSSSPIATIFRIMAYIVLAFLILIVGVVLISILLGLITALFGFSTIGIGLWPIADLIFESKFQSIMLYISSILLILLPIIIIVRWLILRINKKPRKSKWLGYTLSSLFLLSLFSVVFILSSLISDVKNSYRKTADLTLQTPIDTLVITQNNMIENNDGFDDWTWVRKSNDGKYQLQIASLKVLPSEDSTYHFQLERQSNGASLEMAKKYAEGLAYTYQQDGNILKLPQYLSLPAGDPFRGQLLTAIVYIPKGKVFKIGNLPANYAKNWQLNARPILSFRLKHNAWLANRYYKMSEDGVVDLID